MLAAGGGYFWLQQQFEAPGPAAVAARILIEPRASLRSVLGRLEASGAVRNARAVEVYLRLRRREPRVRPARTRYPRRPALGRSSRSSRRAKWAWSSSRSGKD